MLAKKWNFKRQEYEDYELPENCPLICHDIEKIINCATCGEKIKFGECYCSKTIHNKSGFGYPVCKKCYNKELKKLEL